MVADVEIGKANPRRPRVVLVVDPVPDHRESVVRAFSSDDDAILELAGSMAEAETILAERPISAIVLSGAHDPKRGLECLGLVARAAGRLPIVFLADESQSNDFRQILACGASEVVAGAGDRLALLPGVVAKAIEYAALREEVRTSERQYRDLIEASSDAVYVLQDDHFLFVNQRFCELFGWSKGEILDPRFDYRRLVSQESRELIEERGRRVREHQPLPSRYEFRALRRDGSGFDAEVSVGYIRYGGVSAVLGILQDISPRKAYEKKLLRKNHELSVLNAIAEASTRARELALVLDEIVERLIELLEVDAAGISVLDERGTAFASVHFRGASETFVREMRGRRPEDGIQGIALSTRTLQIIEDLEHDPRVRQGTARREGFRSAVSIPVMSHERCFGVISVFTRSPRRFAMEDVALFVAIARQIAVAIESARLYRKAQEGIARLQALSEIARAIGSTLDVEGVFRIVGERLQSIVPYRRICLNILRAEVSRFSVRTIDLPSLGEAPVVRLHEPVVATESSPLYEVLTRQTTLVVEPDCSIPGVAHPAYPVEHRRSALVPIVAEGAAIGVFVVTAGDVLGFRERDLDLLQDLAAHMAISLKNARVFQELERAYRDLRDTKDRLVRSEKLQSLGEMAAGVAHDFNNILSAILGRAQMLKVMITDETKLRSIHVIEKAALDAAGTVRRIQEFAKAKSDGNLVPVRLNSLVRDVIELTTPRLHDMAIAIDVQVDLGDAGTVRGDPSEIREVLTNLVHNAIDAMPHGGRLSVRTSRDETHAWIEVEDTGIGMDPDTQNRIFDPFFTTKGTRGTGLGLSVSYGIVQRHRGEFVVRSEKGVGTTIRVLLPVLEAESPSGPPESLTPLPTDVIESARARVLVIDDDAAVREVLADILRTGDHEVHVAGSGEEGLGLFGEQKFDLVFTDLGMPGMNGWEVAKGVKKLSPSTPVGLITGWGSSLDEAQVKNQGVDLIVSKPFRYKQVLQLVAEAMELKGRFAP